MPTYNSSSSNTSNSHPFHRKIKSLSSIGIFAICVTLATSAAASPNGKPFKKIAKQIKSINSQIETVNETVDMLSTQIDDINTVINNQVLTNSPVSADVDCTVGQTIGAVIDTYTNSNAQLTINISGVCNEAVFVLRDNVSLIGVTPDAGISTTSPYFGAVTVSQGAKLVEIKALSLYGPSYGLIVTKNSQAAVTEVNASAGLYAVLSLDNAVLDITSSVIHDSQIGLLASRNGVISVSGSTISNNNTGGLASLGGMMNVFTTAPSGLPTTPVNFDGNVFGLNAAMEGKLAVTSATISNGTFGVLLSSTGFARINNSSITNMSLAGVSVQKAASAFFNNGNYFVNNASGVSCVPGSNYVVSGPLGSLPGTFVNNGVDNNSCIP